MAEALCTYIENDRPFLGICLGLQLLFESSDENGPGGVPYDSPISVSITSWWKRQCLFFHFSVLILLLHVLMLT